MLALPPPPLPTPSGVGLALLRAMQRDDVELDELAEIVSSDPTLTGRLLKLANSAVRMQREVDAAKRNGTPLWVLMVDIDRFKAVNDPPGHDVGDTVLREVAHLLRASLRSIDALCRLGGEEFLVICPGTSLGDAARVADRLCAVAREHTIELPGFQRAVTISGGAACLTGTTDSVDGLIKQADERVYLTKQGGRNRVMAAGPSAVFPPH